MENENCNAQDCREYLLHYREYINYNHIDLAWTEWSSWSSCDDPMSHESHCKRTERSRTCEGGTAGQDCPGEDSEKKLCGGCCKWNVNNTTQN